MENEENPSSWERWFFFLLLLILVLFITYSLSLSLSESLLYLFVLFYDVLLLARTCRFSPSQSTQHLQSQWDKSRLIVP